MLSAEEFLTRFLAPRRPVILRSALSDWAWAPEWRLRRLVDRFGGHRVPLYDTLFSLRGLSTFAGYVSRYMGNAACGAPPYLRWYARQSADRMPWADAAFADLAEDWSMPAWLPSSGYVFPHTTGSVNAARDPFPAKGLFVCGRGGRTRLHVDPWASDACLCQTTGTKHVVMYSPAAAALLTGDGGVVDLHQPDSAAFPRWRQAVADVDVVLRPGDWLYIPAGWFHAATALTDSVSITWNFVHEVHTADFERYLSSGGAADGTVKYFNEQVPPGLSVR
jgi:hypothetical protein